MQSEQSDTNTHLAEDQEFSVQQQLGKLADSFIYALKQWRILLPACLLGGAIGIVYYFLKPIDYTARTTFVVEESKLSGGSLASSLAGQFGLDIGGLTGSSSSGILAGDNVLELVKSHNLIRKTLLSPYDNTGKTLADVYAETSNLKKKWEKSSKVGKFISFADPKMGRTEDSLMQKVITRIIQNSLSIGKPDRKLSFFEFTVTSRDEKFSLLFSQRLLKATTDFYIETKTRRLVNNVKRLQDKADSLAGRLNQKTYSAANANRLLLDANPVYAQSEVSAEISSREKIMQSTIYAEIVKNLEISRTALIQETPTIQVVDDPEIPLQDNHIYWWTALLTGILAAAAVTCIAIVLLKKRSVRNDN